MNQLANVHLKPELDQTTKAQAYELNGQVVDASSFTAAACDPHRSVVVEACAGSGKTWLLVARMLRLLLDGAEPAELLAITFTRKAAQEMRHRLMELLTELALADEVAANTLLRERGVPEHQLAASLPRARNLYENLLSNPQGLSMDTFHSWFGRLLQLAPLASGVPHGFNLVESTSSLQREAWGQLMQRAGLQSDSTDTDIKDTNIKDTNSLKLELLYLYDELGDFSTQLMLDAFLDKRAEWWAVSQDTSAQTGGPLAQLHDLMGDDASSDARLRLWQDEALLARLQDIGICLGKGSPENQKRGVAIETALTNAKLAMQANAGLSVELSVEHFAALANEFYGSDGTNRKNRKTKALTAAIAAWLGENNESAFHDECNAIAETLKVFERRSKEASVLRLNQALFVVGQAYVECYQTLKSEQRMLDFADLEWQAYRLLSNEEFAAYLHGRLDARYKHILLDEFQDTNPLQWNIVRAWLDAYGADTSRPTVFIVGDPKQSIYRFRRADPRVFTAARQLLGEQGAVILRTNQTRRNAPAIVEALNKAMIGNAIYSDQTTAATFAGHVMRLPLIRGDEVRTDSTEDCDAPFPLRDPLTTPALEQDDQRRYQEGQQLAQILLQLRNEAAEPFKWSDVMLLVRRRSNLSAYESALREAGIPFVSSRRGGLLQTLEIADLIALLNFLMTPGDNRSLAHVLKSPMFGACDQDLIKLAQRAENAWWKRLLALDKSDSPHLQRAVDLLAGWMQAAHDLPVHDLLDRILHQGELVCRYARASSATNRQQIIGNITAFTELALNMDGGRYPSLPKFIAALNEFDRGAETDSPDESSVANGLDAVRILTIHSAKGLEAKIVAMLDSNHSDAAKDNIGVLCSWPLQPGEQKHFSVFGKKDERGAARDRLFAAEEEQAKQENWNLLYVAATRAKQVLIVSGIASDKAADETGVQAASWYQRFSYLDESEVSAKKNSAEAVTGIAQEEFILHTFNPPNLALPELKTAPLMSEEQIEGVALHALMERLTNRVLDWPIQIPSAEVVANWLPCALSVAKVVREQAQTILNSVTLKRFFHPEEFVFARNEMDIVYQEQVMRLDRMVALDDEVWILDYKRQLLASEKNDYLQQLTSYAAALAPLYPMKKLKLALILADGQFIPMN
ncbi:UvrD-helicase domain-containing protein [Undibacterium sp. Ji22W]|uniref:UvrD-helicase domain-containing protein n=1 Tax=Undibacterium sp. Ji22W TaxID=3413038 RepID=UPI003BF1EEBB